MSAHELERNQSEDMASIFAKIDSSPQQRPKAVDSEVMQVLWEEQRKRISSGFKKGFQWHPKIIRVCLQLYSRSRGNYEQLRNTGMLVLPSGRTLQRYANAVRMERGICWEHLERCR
jgi:hypothetical protein